MNIKKLHSVFTTGLFCISGVLVAASGAVADDATIMQTGDMTIITMPERAGQIAGSGIDFANAVPLALPKVEYSPYQQESAIAIASLGEPGHRLGGLGNGLRTPVLLPKSNFIGDQSDATPREFGLLNHPYATSRVNAIDNQASKFYPYRAAGKLYFNVNGGTAMCSASLIAPGIVVTAAHCVADFGKRTFYSNWTFVPAKNGSSAPYGIWSVKTAVIKTSYFDGSDACAQTGVVCRNDVALLRLVAKTNAGGGTYYAGNQTGWYGYGWNGYSYATFLGQKAAQISQLGYPVALDGGNLMERTDSLGYVAGNLSNNTVIGSLQTNGSSGGPWLVNLGMPPKLNGASFGADGVHNIVVGVTSWGYVDNAPKEQGASLFTTENIVSEVRSLCEPAPQPGC